MKKGVSNNEANQVIEHLTTLQKHNFQTHGDSNHQIVEMANFFRELHPERELQFIESVGRDQRQLDGQQVNDYKGLSVSERLDILRKKQKF